jgi:hypothetical protein
MLKVLGSSCEELNHLYCFMVIVVRGYMGYN